MSFSLHSALISRESNNGSQQCPSTALIPLSDKYVKIIHVKIINIICHIPLDCFLVMIFCFVHVAAPLVPNPVGELDRIVNKLLVKYMPYLVEFDVEYVSWISKPFIMCVRTLLHIVLMFLRKLHILLSSYVN